MDKEAKTSSVIRKFWKEKWRNFGGEGAKQTFLWYKRLELGIFSSKKHGEITRRGFLMLLEKPRVFINKFC